MRFRNVLEAALDDGERVGKRNAVGEEQRWLRLREELRSHVTEPRERLVGFREGSHVFHGAFQLEILRNRRAACRGAVV